MSDPVEDPAAAEARARREALTHDAKALGRIVARGVGGAVREWLQSPASENVREVVTLADQMSGGSLSRAAGLFAQALTQHRTEKR